MRLFNLEGASDRTVSALPWDPSRENIAARPLTALSSCRGCHGYAVWDRDRGQESSGQCEMPPPSKLCAETVAA